MVLIPTICKAVVGTEYTKAEKTEGNMPVARPKRSPNKSAKVYSFCLLRGLLNNHINVKQKIMPGKGNLKKPDKLTVNPIPNQPKNTAAPNHEIERASCRETQ